MNNLSFCTPEKAGIASEAVQQFINGLEKNNLPMHGVILMRKETVLAEGYWAPFSPDDLHRIYSCSKSFVSIAIGLLEQENKIKLTDTIASYFPQKLPKGELHPYIAKATIEDLLKMSSPHEKTTYKQMLIDDWAHTFFACSPNHLPGSVFSYDTSATYIMGALVERICKMSLIEYLNIKLLTPIDANPKTYCIPDPMGVSQSGSGIMCTLLDFAKVAMVCTQNGQWQGKQLLPKDYLNRATTPQITNFVSSSEMGNDTGYGYQFWIPQKGVFAFMGMGGQVAVCCPEKQFVAATIADTQGVARGTDIISQLVLEVLLPALSDKPLPANSKAFPSLESTLDELSFIKVGGSHSSPISKKVDGKIITLDENVLGWKSFCCTFDTDGGKINFVKATGSYSIPFGFGENRQGIFPEYNYQCLTSAGWWNERTLNIACFTIGEYNAPLRITIYFKEDNTTTIHMSNAAELFMEQYIGFASSKLQTKDCLL